MILRELGTKREELESSHSAAVHQIEQDFEDSKVQQKFKLAKHVQTKKETFRDYIMKN